MARGRLRIRLGLSPLSRGAHASRARAVVERGCPDSAPLSADVDVIVSR
jgi:hypothetical protein